jgi:hypothetical protein
MLESVRVRWDFVRRSDSGVAFLRQDFRRSPAHITLHHQKAQEKDCSTLIIRFKSVQVALILYTAAFVYYKTAR